MAVKNDYTYENIEDPYDALLQRGNTQLPSIDLGTTAVSSPNDVADSSIDGKTFTDITLSNSMQSRSYNPKKQGFMIDGKMGYIECMRLFVGTGGIIGGSLDIPDQTSTNSFHVDPQGNTWWGANLVNSALAPAYVLNTGDAMFNNVEITGTSTVGGRLATTIGGAIDAAGDFTNDVVNPRLDTSTEEILGNFTFGASGSIYIATDVNNGIWLSPTGILGKKAGATTFAVTTSGDATFGGSLVAASGTFGTITAGTLQGTLTVGGRLATTIGASIDVSGYFISQLVNSKINTNTQDILLAFDFGTTNYAGGVYAGNITWDLVTGAVTGGSGVAVNRAGIAGANLGTPTFSISAVDGSAYFKGSIGSGTSITAPSITGGSISGTTITGATIQTAASAPNMILNTSNLTGYDSGPVKRMQLDKDSLEFYEASTAYRRLAFNSDGIVAYTGVGADGNEAGSIVAAAGEIGIYAEIGSWLTLNTAHRNSDNQSKAIFFNSYEVGGTLEQLATMYRSLPTGANIFRMAGTINRIEANYFLAAASGYINYGSDVGSTGYGFRDNAGTLQLKNSGGAWVNIPTSAGGGTVTSISAGTNLSATPSNPITTTGTISHITGNSYYHLPFGSGSYQMLYHAGTGEGGWSSSVYIGGSASYYLSLVSSRITSNVDLVASGSLHATGNVYTGGVSDDDGAVYAQTLSTSGSNMTIYTNRHMYLQGASGYNIYVGDNINGSYYPTDINMNYSDDVNFYQSGVIKAIIDNNFWTAGNIQSGTYIYAGSSIEAETTLTAGGTIQNSAGDIICGAGNLQLNKTAAIVAVKDAGGTTRYLTCKLNATLGVYILST